MPNATIRMVFEVLAITLGLALALGACQKERFTDAPSDRLAYSTDTLRFDTVFTQLGSATRILKIYNPHKRSMRISRIGLEGLGKARFDLNVDGLPGAERRDVDIAPNDSLYVFARVTINPDEPLSSSPFVVEAQIVVEYNGNQDRIQMEAWGQNAVYLPSRFGAGSIAGYGCGGGEWVWDDPRPYVIYGIVVVDSCTVRIPAGKRIYVHGGLGRFVTDSSVTRYNDGFIAFVNRGRLLIEGTQDNPVIIEGDRLEPEFHQTPGQWTGIWLQAGTSGHRIEHAIIRNGIIGVRVDSAADLTLRHTQIYRTTGPAVIGIHARIEAENCLFFRNGGFAIQLEYGGIYRFNYCTAATYGVSTDALRMTNGRCLDPVCQSFAIHDLDAHFVNCILHGSRADQVSLTEFPGAAFAYRLERCIVKVRDLIRPNAYPDFFDYCDPCLNAAADEIIFVDPNRDEYRLDTLKSVANAYARPIPGIATDLDGKMRDPIMPDAGCFEIEF